MEQRIRGALCEKYSFDADLFFDLAIPGGEPAELAAKFPRVTVQFSRQVVQWEYSNDLCPYVHLVRSEGSHDLSRSLVRCPHDRWLDRSSGGRILAWVHLRLVHLAVPGGFGGDY
jgi:hypothetical protein